VLLPVAFDWMGYRGNDISHWHFSLDIFLKCFGYFVPWRFHSGIPVSYLFHVYLPFCDYRYWTYRLILSASFVSFSCFLLIFHFFGFSATESIKLTVKFCDGVRRHFGNSKIAISPQEFYRIWWSLSRWRILAPYLGYIVLTVPISDFVIIAISHQRFQRSSRNLARWCKCRLPNVNIRRGLPLSWAARYIRRYYKPVK